MPTVRRRKFRGRENGHSRKRMITARVSEDLLRGVEAVGLPRTSAIEDGLKVVIRRRRLKALAATWSMTWLAALAGAATVAAL